MKCEDVIMPFGKHKGESLDNKSDIVLAQKLIRSMVPPDIDATVIKTEQSTGDGKKSCHYSVKVLWQSQLFTGESELLTLAVSQLLQQLVVKYSYVAEHVVGAFVLTHIRDSQP